MTRRKTCQGRYIPKNPGKYVGNVNTIQYRSSYEYYAFKVFDLHPDVVEWSSESVVIPYISPKDGKQHRYFVDIYVKYKTKDGKYRVELIEIKPYSQTQPPKHGNKAKKSTIVESQLTWEVNKSKWKAASEYAKKRGWTFRIITEKELWKGSGGISGRGRGYVKHVRGKLAK